MKPGKPLKPREEIPEGFHAELVNQSRRHIRALCKKYGITRKQFKKIRKIQRRR